MRINLMPMFAWYLLIVAGMILFAFPPLIAGDILFEMERMFDWPFFNAARGGDPLLWQHLFWIFGHPEVYIIFLPAIALMAMIVPTFSQRPIVGYSWIVLAAVGTGFLSFGLWVHHMFTTGLPQISLAFFSAASEAVAIPTGVQIFVFIATMLAGRVIFSLPMLFGAGGLIIFVIGGLTGVMVALVPFDWQAHDTYFIVAHLHYVLIGGMLFPVVAGIHYYFPFVTGKKLSDAWGKISFWLMFSGFNLAFFPMHFSGLRGMPRRVFTYPADIGWDWFNLISTLGAFVFAAGVAILVIDILRPKPQAAQRNLNPWNSGTLEWTNDPSEDWGMRSVPIITSRYPLWDQPNLQADIEAGRFYLPDAKSGKRETLITSVLDAKPLQCLRVGGVSYVTIVAALALGGVFIALTFHWWIAAIVAGVVTFIAIVYWLKLPIYVSGPSSVGWWAMFITMVGDGTAFASLIFGYFFYWTIHPDFTDRVPGPGVFWPMTALALFLAAWGLTVLARRLNGQGRTGARLALLAGAITTTAASLAGLAGPYFHTMDPTADVYPATVWVVILWAVAHGVVGVIMQLYCLARSLAGRMTAEYDQDICNVTLYWHFMALTAMITFAAVGLFPLVAS
jgi:cytochrome c oxidase subunit I+III